MTRDPSAHLRLRLGFTLLEVMVSSFILVLILTTLWSVLSMVQRSFRLTAGHLDTFEAGRAAFDQISRTAAQATLMSYFSPNDPTLPNGFALRSDLHFISGPQRGLGLKRGAELDSHAVFFQAPLGIAADSSLSNANLLLASTGFLIRYGDDSMRPTVANGRVASRYRYRLYQWIQPRDHFSVYDFTLETQSGIIVSNKGYNGTDWFSDPVNAERFLHPLADNVILLLIRPMRRGQPVSDYLWNSRNASSSLQHHQVPDTLDLVLVVIDEASAASIGNPTIPPAYIPETLFHHPNELDDDLLALEEHFGRAMVPSIRYRILRTAVPLNAATPNQ